MKTLKEKIVIILTGEIGESMMKIPPNFKTYKIANQILKVVGEEYSREKLIKMIDGTIDERIKIVLKEMINNLGKKN